MSKLSIPDSIRSQIQNMNNWAKILAAIISVVMIAAWGALVRHEMRLDEHDTRISIIESELKQIRRELDQHDLRMQSNFQGLRQDLREHRQETANGRP